MRFWDLVDAELDRIEAEKPSTYDGVVAILGGPFFAGSGGDRQLHTSLRVAGWVVVWVDWEHFYAMRHPATGEVLTYIEGDVQRGDNPPFGGVR